MTPQQATPVAGPNQPAVRGHHPRWTAASVAAHLAATPKMDWDTENDAIYAARYVRPVTEFGLTVRIEACVWDDQDTYRWEPDQMPRETVPVDRITSSTQTEGVCLDVIDHYIRNPHQLIDPDGWFGNDIPVLIRRTDGTYTIRDGNHRSIAAILRRDTHLDAHVVW